jgi:hypothetical protein
MGESGYLIFCAETDASGIVKNFTSDFIRLQNSPVQRAMRAAGIAKCFHSRYNVRRNSRAGVFIESRIAIMQGKKCYAAAELFSCRPFARQEWLRLTAPMR